MQARPFDDHRGDLSRLSDFVVEACGAVAPDPWDFHPGDLLWQRHVHTDDVSRWHERVHIWEDASGDVLGFAVYYIDPNELVPLIRPDLIGDGPILRSMIDWGFSMQREHHGTPEPANTLLLSALEQSEQATLLEKTGWEIVEEPPLILYEQSLDSLPERTIARGFTVRPLNGQNEYGKRVAIHKEAFHPSRFSLDAYKRLRTIDGYDPGLDLVTVSPQGVFASFCIVWYDSVNRTGFFEPVGSSAAFRRKGLTRSTLVEAFHRLADRGAQRALVASDSSNEPACKLYESAGFTHRTQWNYFRRV